MNLKSRLWLALAGVMLLLAARAGAMEGRSAKPYEGSADFQRVRALAGVWKGTADLGNGPQEVSVEFRPTAGGSAVEQRLFPGTPHEMLDVYYDQGKSLRMVHYCAMGNRPHMALKKSDEKEMRFVLSNDPVIDPVRDAHMHSLKIFFIDADNIVEEWVSFKRGKSSGTTRLTLTRVPPEPAAVPSPTPGR